MNRAGLILLINLILMISMAIRMRTCRLRLNKGFESSIKMRNYACLSSLIERFRMEYMNCISKLC